MSQHPNSEGLQTVMRRNLTGLEEQKASVGHVPASDCAAHQVRTIMFLMAGSLMMGFVMLKCRDLWFGPQQQHPHIHRKREFDEDEDEGSQSNDEAREQDKSDALRKEAQQKEQHQQQNHGEEYRYHFSMKEHLNRECQDDLATLDDEYAKSFDREEEEDETEDDQSSKEEASDGANTTDDLLPNDDAGHGDSEEAEGGDVADEDLVMTEGEPDNVEGSYVVVSKRKKDL